MYVFLQKLSTMNILYSSFYCALFLWFLQVNPEIGAWKGKRVEIVLLQQKACQAIHLVNYFLSKASTTPASHTYHLRLAHSNSYMRHILKHMLRFKQHDCNEMWRCKTMLPLASTLLAWIMPKNKFVLDRLIGCARRPCLMNHEFMEQLQNLPKGT